MPKTPTAYDKLMLAMQCAAGGKDTPFVTRAELAAFGAALLESLTHATTLPEQEYCTLSYLARRFQCSRDYMAVRLAHPSIRKVQIPGGKRVKYHIQDALHFLSSSQNLHPVLN